MRLVLTTLAAGLAAGLAVGILGFRPARAALQDGFILEPHDTLLAEAPGCYAECRAVGTRRVCTVRELDCQAICRTIPECRPDGRPVQVCAVMRLSR
jgi:hypothetical protein